MEQREVGYGDGGRVREGGTEQSEGGREGGKERGREGRNRGW